MNIILLFALVLSFDHVVRCLWVKEMENDGLYEGDIVLSPDQQVALNNGDNAFGSKIGGRWGTVIPYYIDSSIGGYGNQAIHSAILQYHKHTCLRFKKRSGEWDYIKFKSGSGCSSPIGKRSIFGNTITLGNGCFRIGTVMHEIGHSLGLYHEQARPDRDQFISIIRGNIKSGKGHNFDKQSRGSINSLGTKYDFGSMMHYSGQAFGKYGKMTIKTKDPRYQSVIGQRDGFSKIDIEQINLMYKCKIAPPTLATQSPPVNGCNNKHTRCDEWAQRGECKVNPYYMQKNCKKACNICT